MVSRNGEVGAVGGVDSLVDRVGYGEADHCHPGEAGDVEAVVAACNGDGRVRRCREDDGRSGRPGDLRGHLLVVCP